MAPPPSQDVATPRWRSRLAALFGLDVRSLALLRIGLAAVILWDVGTRLRDLEAHYADSGVLPIGLLPTPGPGRSDLMLPPSLHLIDGSPAFQAILLVLTGAVAAALLVGWRTRLATILAWFLTISLYSRNPLVSHGGDTILRILLFWSMFLPLGACASLDARGRPAPPRRVLSLGTAALLLQMCLFVWFAALLKYDPAWRSDGDAVYRALVIGHSRTPIGDLVLQSRGLMEFLTFATLVQEGLVPFLLFVPWQTWRLRVVVVGSFVAFHATLGLCMELGTFQPVCIVGWLALLPTELWDRLAATRLAAASRRLRDAIIRSFAAGGGGAHAPATPTLPALVRPLSGPANCAIAFLLVYVLAGNFNNWTEPRSPDANPALQRLLDVRDAIRRRFHVQNANLGYVLGLDQQWYLFAPKPVAVHGWLVLDATLNDGTHVDLLPFCLDGREAPLSFERPKRIADTYPNLRWRKYLTNLIAIPSEKLIYRHAFAIYAATRWNGAHARDPSRRLRTLDLYLMRETTLPDYAPVRRDKVRLLRLDGRAPDLRASSAVDLEAIVVQ